MMEFYNRSLPEARKTHTCEFCGKEIQSGEKYSYETGKYEGEFFVRKLCLICEQMLSDFIYESDDNEFDWWEITDWLRDKYCVDCQNSDENGDCYDDLFPENCERVRKEFMKIEGVK